MKYGDVMRVKISGEPVLVLDTEPDVTTVLRLTAQDKTGVYLSEDLPTIALETVEEAARREFEEMAFKSELMDAYATRKSGLPLEANGNIQ